MRVAASPLHVAFGSLIGETHTCSQFRMALDLHVAQPAALPAHPQPLPATQPPTQTPKHTETRHPPPIKPTQTKISAPTPTPRPRAANVDEGLRGYLTKYDCSSADINPIGEPTRAATLQAAQSAVEGPWTTCGSRPCASLRRALWQEPHCHRGLAGFAPAAARRRHQQGRPASFPEVGRRAPWIPRAGRGGGGT